MRWWFWLGVISACTSSTPEGAGEGAPEAAPPKVVSDEALAAAEITFRAVATVGRPVPTDPGRFAMPSGIAIDSKSGDIYVADTGNKRVQRFSADGKFLAQWKTRPIAGLSVDPSNQTVLVVHNGEKVVVRYSPEGEELGRIGNAKDDGLINPVDVSARADGRIYLLDKAGYITIYNKIGRFVTRWPAMLKDDRDFRDGGRVAQQDRSMGMTLSRDGKSLYVANTGQTRVRQFDLDGDFIREWGGDRGHGDGTLRWCRGIAVTREGNVIVADTDNERLHEFTATGEFVRWFRGLHNQSDGIFHPRAVAANTTTGQICATASYSNRVDCFSPDGELTFSLGGRNPEPDVLNEPRGIAVDPTHGDIYVADRREHLVRRFGKDGTAKPSFIPLAGDLSAFDPMWAERVTFQFWGPIAFAPDGTIWMTRQGYKYPEDPTPSEHLRHYDRDGAFLGLMGHEAFAGYLEGLDIHEQTGDFFVSSQRSKDVMQLSPAGELIRSYGADIMTEPSGLAVDEARERVYVADTKAQKIHAFSLAGAHVASWGEPGKALGQLALIRSAGIGVDECGLVYIADVRNRRVQVFRPDGAAIAELKLDAKKRANIRDVDIVGDMVHIAGDGYVQQYRREGISCR